MLAEQPGGDSLQIAGVACLTNNADITSQFPTAFALRTLAAEQGRSLDRRFADAMIKARVPVTSGLANGLGISVAVIGMLILGSLLVAVSAV